jgi:isopropylmalate/homocitrate/citramalate synthase
MSWLRLGSADPDPSAGPAFLRATFPYDLPPIAWFAPDAVPLDPPGSIWITDTTFRDGQQSRAPYTVDQIVHLYDLLHRLGGAGGMVRQTEFFLYTRRDREAVDRCRALGHRFPEVTGWIRATMADYDLVKKLGSDRTTVLEGYLRVVDAALEDGVVPRVHLEDVTRADVATVVIPFVHALMERGRQAGVEVKVRFPDTLGVGVPFAHATLPRGIPRLTRALRHDGGVPADALEFHGQNDMHAIVPNAVAAWLHGAAVNNGTLLGIGERSGNTPIEALVFWLISLTGETHGMDTTVITDIADYYRAIGEPVDARLPFVGDNFNVTRAGIHADGMIKDEEIYNPFDTTRLLNRPPGVAITDKSGAAGLLMWLRANRPDLAEDVTKQHAGLRRLAEAVEQLYTDGRTTSLSDAEVEALAVEALATRAGTVR